MLHFEKLGNPKTHTRLRNSFFSHFFMKIYNILELMYKTTLMQ